MPSRQQRFVDGPGLGQVVAGIDSVKTRHPTSLEGVEGRFHAEVLSSLDKV
jgi:hypothetical protein